MKDRHQHEKIIFVTKWDPSHSLGGNKSSLASLYFNETKPLMYLQRHHLSVTSLLSRISDCQRWFLVNHLLNYATHHRHTTTLFGKGKKRQKGKQKRKRARGRRICLVLMLMTMMMMISDTESCKDIKSLSYSDTYLPIYRETKPNHEQCFFFI